MAAEAEQWEYHLHVSDGSSGQVEEELNELGAHEWNAVGFRVETLPTASGGHVNNWVVLLKRPDRPAVEIKEDVVGILAFLADIETRATYKAVADMVGGIAQSIGKRLGPRRIEASWVVNGRTGLPTGFPRELRHPRLESKPDIIKTGDELRARMKAHVGR